jgi:DNA-binding MarR family transcriptional regulator
MSNERKFKGYAWPRYTPTPDEYYDFHMQDMSLGEMRVLSYIIRRTLGSQRNAENISLDEMLNGRMTADGRILDRGTGLSKSTLVASIRSLEDKGFIVVERRQSDDKGYERNIYRLNMQEPHFHGDQPESDPANTRRQ